MERSVDPAALRFSVVLVNIQEAEKLSEDVRAALLSYSTSFGSARAAE